MKESSLEMTESCRGEMEQGNRDKNPVCKYFVKKIVKVSLVCLSVILSWQQISDTGK